MRLATCFALLIIAVEIVTPKAATVASWLATSTMLVVPLLLFFGYILVVMLVEERRTHETAG